MGAAGRRAVVVCDEASCYNFERDHGSGHVIPETVEGRASASVFLRTNATLTRTSRICRRTTVRRPIDLAESIRRYSTGTPWEAVGGYSRAIRSGDRIYVSGTTASGEAGVLGLDNAGEQARAVLEIIRGAIESLGGSLSDVVRTRIYVKDISHWESVARVHGEFFAEIRPACTLVEARLVDESLLVEIEAEAVVAEAPAGTQDAL